MTAQRILCIDDETVGLRIRAMLLRRAGYEVLTASSGAEGLALLPTSHIDAVILDYSMPEMDGPEVAAAIKAKFPRMPILLLSAYVGLPAGAKKDVSLYMTKGEGAPALLQKLHDLLSEKS